MFAAVDCGLSAARAARSAVRQDGLGGNICIQWSLSLSIYIYIYVYLCIYIYMYIYIYISYICLQYVAYSKY